MLEELRNDVEQFLNNTGSYTSTDSMVRAELMGFGIVSGEEGMKWETAGRDFTIDISRDDGQLWMEDTRFIIKLRFFNNLGVNLAEIRFNEIFMVDLLYHMVLFMADHIGPFDLYCETYNLTMEGYLFRFNRISATITIMEIWRHSKVEGYQSRVLRIEMSDEKYNELIFRLFFATLSDIDVAAADIWHPSVESDISSVDRVNLHNKLQIVEEYVAIY